MNTRNMKTTIGSHPVVKGFVGRGWERFCFLFKRVLRRNIKVEIIFIFIFGCIELFVNVFSDLKTENKIVNNHDL